MKDKNKGTVLSIQGAMAVGKTTALKYLESKKLNVNIVYEDNSKVIEEIKNRGLNKDVFEEYIEIQRLWIRNEIERGKNAKKYGFSIMDYGAEEIEFYTLNYPKSKGLDWNVYERLHKELEELRKFMPDRILFLNGKDETLYRNKEKDKTRSRNFFDYQINNLLPLKKDWLLKNNNVDVLNVDNLSKEEVGEKLYEWVKSLI